MTSIKDVAKLAKVSMSTVSLTLNCPERVSEATRQKVYESIKALNYLPSASFGRKQFNDRQNKPVLLISSSQAGPYFYELIRGATEGLYLNKIDTLYINDYDNSGDTVNRLFKQFIALEYYTGAIVVGDIIQADIISEVVKKHFPLVLCCIEKKYPGVNSIFVDNHNAGVLMADHFIHLGYRRFAIIGDYTSDRIPRMDGFIERLTRHGLHVEPECILPAKLTESGGYSAIYELLGKIRELPEAIFCLNDEIAIGAMMALKTKGLSVPEDIAIAGCDDITMARYNNPTLTTIAMPKFEQGLLAAGLLIRSLNHKSPEQITMSVRLIVRESCGSELRKK
jgi:DNA-binding LacI/PurR family transcriptional regulator